MTADSCSCKSNSVHTPVESAVVRNLLAVGAPRWSNPWIACRLLFPGQAYTPEFIVTMRSGPRTIPERIPSKVIG